MTAHHGTTAGYYRHRDHGTPICDDCREAFNRDQRAYRGKDPDRQGVHFPVPDLPLLPGALCRQVGPGLWDSDNPATSYVDTQAAKAVCGMCPEREACLEYAMQYPVAQLTGVWGGLTQRERRTLRTETRRAS